MLGPYLACTMIIGARGPNGVGGRFQSGRPSRNTWGARGYQMRDKYCTFADLADHELEGKDFRIACRLRKSPYAIVAPHGGSIEPGTSQIANAVAGANLSFYAFEGLKPSDNGVLHITSTRFDEPRCLALIAEARTVITIHGRDGADQIVFLGGLDTALARRIEAALDAAGFTVRRDDDLDLQGTSRENLCNRGISGVGVQLEISNGLRRTLFRSLRVRGRGFFTHRFPIFTGALRGALLHG